LIVGVLVEITNRNVDKIFDYKVPKNLENDIKVGIRVSVPFGRMTIEGFVMEIKESSELSDLKEIIDIVDKDVVLNSELLELGKTIKDKTLATLMSCYQTMLPKALKAKKNSTINIKYDTYYMLGNTSGKFNNKQLEIINLVKEKGEVLRKDLIDISLSSLNTLIKKGALLEVKKEHYRVDYSNEEITVKELTPDQKACVNAVINGNDDAYLLYGVTGSGKTEVYMEIIDYYLKQNKTSIVLVPEISLTPQMVKRFSERFGNNIAAIHSALSEGEKYDEWRRIYRGEAKIVIGARSAIFAPLENIGVIIIDEEHSDSYKQSDPSPRYSAKEVALIRGKTHHCPVVMGSATPSLEAMARAKKGVFKLLELPNRINGRELPKVEIVDMNKCLGKSKGYFSPDLITSISNCMNRNEQVILLLNRRGYASFVSCKNCGFTFKCPNCDITLTYHKSSNTMRCHYCGHGEKVFDKCPECGEKALSNLGVGTQKIEEELNKLFPNNKIVRMDFDTTSKKGMHEKIIEDFKNHNYDILLGTQMVSKGLDFPNVTLVGVINADTSLNIPDFRSSENTFSLLDQVAGRSGRSEKEGKVIIQTFNPDHYAIKLVKKHDYLEFYNEEMQIRRKLKYPPFYYLCNIRISGKDTNYLLVEANKIKRSLERNLSSTIILGPSNSSIFKMNNIYRFNILLKYKKDDSLYPILNKILEHYKTNSKVKVDIDFNPSQTL